jgi:hypothetical protein
MFTVDAATAILGWCNWYLWGVYYRTEARDINTIHVTTVTPVGNAALGGIRPLNPTWTQSVDSRNVGSTSGAVSGLLEHEGRYRINVQTEAMPTLCQIPAFSPVTERLVFATDCRPQWLTTNGNMLHPPPGEIVFNIPSGMSDLRPIADAVATDIFASLGVRIRPVVNQPCGGIGNRCVTINESFPIPPNNRWAQSCGDFDGESAWPETGLRRGPSVIRFRRDWRRSDPTHTRRRLAHEFMHYFGLANRTTRGCNRDNTIMGRAIGPTTDGCTNPNPLPATVPMGPTDNDRNALVGPTYPTQNRRICGFTP